MNISFDNHLLTKVCVLVVGSVFAASCNTDPGTEHRYFEELTNQEEVVIVLSSYGLDSLPPDVGLLKNARELTISYDSVKLGQWVVLPPLNALYEMVDRPPFHILPAEITQLPRLNKLSIIGLNLRQLPKDFDKLKQLEYLDLSMNKLTVTNELNKLSGLPLLKKLVVFGNRIDTAILKNWNNQHPDLEIIY
ncbi:MAG: hypothetical protein RIB71_21720 [Imperialibacter sp.]|uniref:hypothetical protein n=1 Tax=Imperialibacter sp. TaxID=2038411 RepID=UPI0032EEB7E6